MYIQTSRKQWAILDHEVCILHEYLQRRGLYTLPAKVIVERSLVNSTLFIGPWHIPLHSSSIVHTEILKSFNPQTDKLRLPILLLEHGTVATQAEGSSLYLPMTRQNTSRELFKDALHVVSSWNNFLGPDPLLREFL